MMSRLRDASPALVLVLVGLAIWETAVRAELVDALLLPSPTQIATALWEDRRLLSSDLLVTTWEVVAGLAVAVAVGAALGVAMHLSTAVRRTLKPLVVGSQAVPVPVVAPLLILVLGFGLAPKVLMVALVCFFPVTINLYDGLRSVEPDQRKVLRSFAATRWQTLRLLEAPAALPQVFTGIRVAAAVAVIGAVFAEWAGSDSGLGHALLTANGQLLTARAFACVVLLFALAVALYELFSMLERRLVRWAPTRESPGGS
jgi:NitT/TauT family transport system permease protein/putative hydroxymethylpyrimidine transport system permease protein